MKTFQAFVLSLLLHLLLLWLFFILKEHSVLLPLPPHAQKITLNIQQFQAPVPQKKAPTPKVKKVTKKVEKIVEKIDNYEEILREEKEMDALVRELFQAQRALDIEKTFLTAKKKRAKKKIYVKSKYKKQKKRRVKKTKYVKSQRSKKYLAKKLLQEVDQITNSFTYTTSAIGRAYGMEFDTFTSTQKKFIEKNLNIIQKITQRTLSRRGYPDVSVRTLQQGTNIVSFYLHPNGDISKLTLNKNLGFESLDKNTLKTIRIAYKSYPHPKQKTKIKFYVTYSLN